MDLADLFLDLCVQFVDRGNLMGPEQPLMNQAEREEGRASGTEQLSGKQVK